MRILALQRLLHLPERRPSAGYGKADWATTVAIYLDFARIGRTIGKFIIDFNVSKMNIMSRRRGPIGPQQRSNVSTIREALRLAMGLIWVKLNFIRH